jgi:DNA-binding winged helix-turn-helix (wHTH) protein
MRQNRAYAIRGNSKVSQVRVRFDDFTVDSEARQLLRRGDEIRLRGKAFDLLCLLIAERPRVVSRPALTAEIWDKTHVGPASLDELVKVIRRALADNAREPRYIKTHPGGRGFSFCGLAVEEARASRTSAAAPFQLVWDERVFPLAAGENLIGRSHDCDVCVGDATVSRTHAKIHCDLLTGEVVIEDLNSENRTYVGGAEVRTSRRLTAGDVIEMGAAKLRFQAASEPAKTRKLPGRQGQTT